MTRNADDPQDSALTSRRTMLRGIVAVAGAVALAPAFMARVAQAQVPPITGNEPPVQPPTTVSNPRATSARTARRQRTLQTRTLSPLTRRLTRCASAIRPSSGCGPGHYGRKARPGTAWGGI